MSRVLLRRQGNLVDASPTDGTPFPVTVRTALETALTYTHKQFVRGADAIDPVTGATRKIILRPVYLYTYDGSGRLVFPRGFADRITTLLSSYGYAVDTLRYDPPIQRPDCYTFRPERVFERMQLRAKQDEILACFATYENGAIVAPTGVGKTTIFASLALAYPTAKFHIVTKRQSVSDRIYSKLQEYIPNVGRVGGGKRRWGRVTVVTAGSLHLVDHTAVGEPDFCILDESHEGAADNIASELARYQTARMWMATATHNMRFDGADYRMEGLFGPVRFTMTYQEAVALALVLPIEVEWLNIRMDPNPAEGKSGVPHYRWGVWRNIVRNQEIADRARKGLDDGQVLIIVSTFEHACYLKRLLPEFKLCYATADEKDYGRMAAERAIDSAAEPIMTKTRRFEMMKQFESGELRGVIATDVWTTGVDFPMLATLIRADARGSDTIDDQAGGRPCRTHAESGKQCGRVVDCMDHFDSTLLDRSRGRLRSYRRLGWEAPYRRGGSA